MNTDKQDRIIELFCEIIEDLIEKGLRGEIFIKKVIDCECTGFLPEPSDDMYEVLRVLGVSKKAELFRIINLGDQIVLEFSFGETKSVSFSLGLGISKSDRKSFFVELTMNDEEGYFSKTNDFEEYILFSYSWIIPEKFLVE